jgi:hypothetical protein
MATKVNIKKPNSKGAPPSLETPSPVVGNNTSKPEAGETVSLNFRVRPEMRREFKAFAAEHEMRMIEVLEDMWEVYKKTKGKG